ncbi:MAG: hypothetical protein RI565_03800 [Schleiferiaceae bacterium]|nr:hypothetical protein [Schleiferiaceae bacterium]
MKGWSEAIERLVKRRLQDYAAPAPDDWDLLEQKLVKAQRWYQGWMAGGLSCVLVLLSSSAGYSPAAPEAVEALRSHAAVTVEAPTLRSWQAFPARRQTPPALMSSGPSLQSSAPEKISALTAAPWQRLWPAMESPWVEALPFFAPAAEPPLPENEHLAYVSPYQHKRRWSYEISINPNFTFRKFTIEPGMENRMHQEFVDAVRHSEKTGFSLNLGLEVSRRVGRITYLHTGLNYITNNFRTDFDFTHFRDAQLDKPTGEIVRYTLKDRPVRVAFTNANQFHYLQVPLSISYEPWINDQVRFNMEAGFSYLRFMGAEGITLDHRTLEEVTLSSRSYRLHMASVNLRLGFQYYVNEQVNIGLEPSLQYFTNTIYSDQYPFDMVPYSVGLAVNLKVKLRP